jgi:hypothetical protein
MIRWLSGLCLLVVCAALLAGEDKKSADDKTSAKIQVTSLSIHKAPPPKPGTFTMSPNGVHMDVRLSLPNRFITGVDVKASKLDRFTDDKDNALFKKSGGLFSGGANWLNEYLVRYDPDGEAVTVQVQGTKPPGNGANKIILKGSLNAKCGSGEKVTDAKEMAFKPKEETEIGPFKVRVSQFGNTVEVLSKEENVKQIEIFDDKRKPILTGAPSHGRNPLDKEKSPYLYSVFLIGKRDKFTVKIHYFTRVESVNVPLDLRVGLSLE